VAKVARFMPSSIPTWPSTFTRGSCAKRAEPALFLPSHRFAPCNRCARAVHVAQHSSLPYTQPLYARVSTRSQDSACMFAVPLPGHA
jgi:hypothetical protein